MRRCLLRAVPALGLVGVIAIQALSQPWPCTFLSVLDCSQPDTEYGQPCAGTGGTQYVDHDHPLVLMEAYGCNGMDGRCPPVSNDPAQCNVYQRCEFDGLPVRCNQGMGGLRDQDRIVGYCAAGPFRNCTTINRKCDHAPCGPEPMDPIPTVDRTAPPAAGNSEMGKPVHSIRDMGGSPGFG